MVRCKFKCDSIETLTYGKGLIYNAKMSPVFSQDPESENKKFWEATPLGAFTVGTVKVMPFEVGKEYYLDITPVE